MRTQPQGRARGSRAYTGKGGARARALVFMSDLGAQAAADGRPSAGASLAQDLSEAAARRPRSRNVKALGHLVPFLALHKGDAAWAGLFLLTATASTLGLSGAVRLL